ncbi:MAG: acyltransferase [Planctomycetota bacterium]|jgi:galactoside O-acetyltransferase
MAFLTRRQLEDVGFKSVGRDVQLSEKASFYNPANIVIGDHARIDDFCILSAGTGGIRIGEYVHVACHATLIGEGEIVLEAFAGVSGRASIYSSSSDASGDFIAPPMVPMRYRKVESGRVFLGEHALVLTGAVILPGVTIHAGAVVGAMALVKEDCDEFGVYVGRPAKKVKERSRGLLELAEQFRAEDARGA